MIDGFEGEKGAIVAGSRGYFLKVQMGLRSSPPNWLIKPAQTHLRTTPQTDCEAVSSPVLCSGTSGVPGASADQLRNEGPPQQEVHYAVHAFLHEERGHAGGGPAQPVRRWALQGAKTFTEPPCFAFIMTMFVE